MNKQLFVYGKYKYSTDAVSALGGVNHGFRLIVYALGMLIAGSVVTFVGLLLLDSSGGRFDDGPGVGQLLL